jgi:hypothetical protein
MSKQNKANKTNYLQAGRLAPDEIAGERIKQAKAAPSTARDRVRRTPADAAARGRKRR